METVWQPPAPGDLIQSFLLRADVQLSLFCILLLVGVHIYMLVFPSQYLPIQPPEATESLLKRLLCRSAYTSIAVEGCNLVKLCCIALNMKRRYNIYLVSYAIIL